MSKNQIYINSTASSSFRDVADQDYIAARACYKNGLTLQFLWMAHQAIEKYLKAILLYNKRSSKDLGHDLNASLKRVLDIEGLILDLTDDVLEFIDYLNLQGPNRYLEKAHFTQGFEILKLDRSVWQIRRYCKVINREIQLPNGENVNLMEAELSAIHSWLNSKERHKFKLIGGHLEKVIKNKRHPQRNMLVWSNFFYGQRRKGTIVISENMTFINPTQVLHPEKFNQLQEVIQFPKEVRQAFANRS